MKRHYTIPLLRMGFETKTNFVLRLQCVVLVVICFYSSNSVEALSDGGLVEQGHDSFRHLEHSQGSLCSRDDRDTKYNLIGAPQRNKRKFTCVSPTPIRWIVGLGHVPRHDALPYNQTSKRNFCNDKPDKKTKKEVFESSLYFDLNGLSAIHCSTLDGACTAAVGCTNEEMVNQDSSFLSYFVLSENSLSSTNISNADIKNLTSKFNQCPGKTSVVEHDKNQGWFRCNSGDSSQIPSFMPCQDWTNCLTLAIYKSKIHNQTFPCQGTIRATEISDCSSNCAELTPENGLGLLSCQDEGQQIAFLPFFWQSGEFVPVTHPSDTTMTDKTAQELGINVTQLEVGPELTELLFDCRAPKFIAMPGFRWSFSFQNGDTGPNLDDLACDGEETIEDASSYTSTCKCKRCAGQVQARVHCNVCLQTGQNVTVTTIVVPPPESPTNTASTTATAPDATFSEIPEPEPTKESWKLPAIIFGAGISVCFLLLLPILICCWRKIGLQSAAIQTLVRDLTEQEERNFLYGDTSSKDTSQYHYLVFAQEFQRKFILSSKQLREGTVKLGSGAYGVVNEGFLRLSEDSEELRVAVKTVKPHAEVQYFLALLSEVKIMAYLEQHENIVQLCGAWIDSIKSRKIAVAVEYCAKGDLLQTLRKSGGCIKTARTEAHLLHAWARDVARGLEYISSKSVIHGDLAARNVLITANNVAKISDYGLSRVVQNCESVYTKKSKVPLPWKWMAPESLESLQFSTYSDVWSYGILLWEIFSLGIEPYVGANFDMDFVRRLKSDGLRLSKPDLARVDVYEMMLTCWDANPSDRLKLSEASENFSRIIQELSNEFYDTFC